VAEGRGRTRAARGCEGASERSVEAARGCGGQRSTHVHRESRVATAASASASAVVAVAVALAVAAAAVAAAAAAASEAASERIRGSPSRRISSRRYARACCPGSHSPSPDVPLLSVPRPSDRRVDARPRRGAAPCAAPATARRPSRSPGVEDRQARTRRHVLAAGLSRESHEAHTGPYCRGAPQRASPQPANGDIQGAEGGQRERERAGKGSRKMLAELPSSR
jgi:hypothetical protein